MRSGNIYETPECDIKTGEWKYRIRDMSRKAGAWPSFSASSRNRWHS
jgi:hypothetical protein